MTDFLDASFTVNGTKYLISFTDWDCRKLAEMGFDVYRATEDEETMRAIFDRSQKLSDVLLFACN